LLGPFGFAIRREDGQKHLNVNWKSTLTNGNAGCNKVFTELFVSKHHLQVLICHPDGPGPDLHGADLIRSTKT
jgi:hypothetical protein